MCVYLFAYLLKDGAYKHATLTFSPANHSLLLYVYAVNSLISCLYLCVFLCFFPPLPTSSLPPQLPNTKIKLLTSHLLL